LLHDFELEICAPNCTLECSTVSIEIEQHQPQVGDDGQASRKDHDEMRNLLGEGKMRWLDYVYVFRQDVRMGQ
jgi:hypothetical protein